MTSKKFYKITSVHHSEIGSVGDVIELSDKEFAGLSYNSRLQAVSKPKLTKEKIEDN